MKSRKVILSRYEDNHPIYRSPFKFNEDYFWNEIQLSHGESIKKWLKALPKSQAQLVIVQKSESVDLVAEFFDDKILTSFLLKSVQPINNG